MLNSSPARNVSTTGTRQCTVLPATRVLRGPRLGIHQQRVGPRCTQARATRTQQLIKEEEQLITEASSFYDILGVPPTATKKQIKTAYLAMMKECHPDRSNMEATEFCALLNEIYETLSDAARRATYDALSGFSLDSVNPFLDTSFERDQVFVDEFTCIGCRNCTNVCPSTFMIEDEFGRARVYQQGRDTPDKQQEAIDTCPVECIHWVSAPQLSLLETAMARMGRVAVWSLGMGNGNNKDVFTEASLAWQKRRSELLRRRAVAVSAQEANNGRGSGSGFGWSGWWNNVVSFEGSSASNFYNQAQQARAKASARASGAADNAYSSSEDEGAEAGEVSERDARNIAALAARAARASRTWKVMQEAQSRLKARVAIPTLSSASLSSVSSMDDLQ